MTPRPALEAVAELVADHRRDCSEQGGSRSSEPAEFGQHVAELDRPSGDVIQSAEALSVEAVRQLVAEQGAEGSFLDVHRDVAPPGASVPTIYCLYVSTGDQTGQQSAHCGRSQRLQKAAGVHRRHKFVDGERASGGGESGNHQILG